MTGASSSMLRPLTRFRPVLRTGAPRAQLPFIPSRPGGPSWRPSGPTSAPVGRTSCIFLMRHQYAPLRLPMETARGSCACSLDSKRVLNPSGLRRRTRRGGAWAGARSPGAEEGLVGRTGAGWVGGRASLRRSPLGALPARFSQTESLTWTCAGWFVIIRAQQGAGTDALRALP